MNVAPPRWVSCRRHYSDTERSGIRQSREPLDYRGIGVIIGVQRRCEKAEVDFVSLAAGASFETEAKK